MSEDYWFGTNADAVFGGQSDGVLVTHGADRCVGRPCVLHHPSDHHMVTWRTVWRADRYLMERICPQHGVGHPDPDHIAFVRSVDPEFAAHNGVHGCCGCCSAV